MQEKARCVNITRPLGTEIKMQDVVTFSQNGRTLTARVMCDTIFAIQHLIVPDIHHGDSVSVYTAKHAPQEV